MISQVEVAVKSYWANIGKLLPQPEIGDMGAVFGGIEVIHSRAYSEILSVLDLEDEFNKLLKFLLNKDIKNFKGLLQEMFYIAVSYYDVGKEEKYYHNLILGFVFGLSDKYEIRSNREYGTGRVDLLLKAKDNKLPDYIFEFKVSKKKEDLEKDCKEALKQIEKRKYGIELKNPVEIGMSFFEKEFEILIKE